MHIWISGAILLGVVALLVVHAIVVTLRLKWSEWEHLRAVDLLWETRKRLDEATADNTRMRRELGWSCLADNAKSQGDSEG